MINNLIKMLFGYDVPEKYSKYYDKSSFLIFMILVILFAYGISKGLIVF